MEIMKKLWQPPKENKSVTPLSSDSTPVTADTPSRPNYLGEVSKATRARSATTVAVDQSAPIVDSQFDAEIRQALDNAKIGGCSELVMQFDELKEDIPDEAKRLKRAASIVTKMLKVNFQQIVNSIKERLSILDNERAQFSQAIQAQADTAVGAQSEVVHECDRRLGEIDSEMQKLVSEKKRVENDRSKAQAEIDAVSTRVDSVKKRFEGTYQYYKNTLTSLLDKMQASGN